MNIFHQSVFDRWPLEYQSVQAIITSPPYWGLRKYDIPDVVIGGRPGCAHKFVETTLPKGSGDGLSFRRDDKAGIQRGLRQPGFCINCGAWKGQYGLEPSFIDFIEHTALWVKEARRVLKDDGVLFINLGDSYGGSWGAFGDGTLRGNQKRKKQHERWTKNGTPKGFPPPTVNARAKCKLLIPHRIAIALIEDGWILRNDIVWYKPNSMPESVKDRFAKKFEYVFMFAKSEEYFFNLDAVRERHATATWERAKRGRKGVGVPETVMPAGQRENTPLPGKLKAEGKNPGDVWSIPNQPSPEEHYAIWPEKLVERLILCSTKYGDAVLDPFAGSGTTLRVAEKLNRKGLGIDLGYKEIQERRLTGIQKVLSL